MCHLRRVNSLKPLYLGSEQSIMNPQPDVHAVKKKITLPQVRAKVERKKAARPGAGDLPRLSRPTSQQQEA
jgi:hypothetical protein